MSSENMKQMLLRQAELTNLALIPMPTSDWVANTYTSKVLARITRPSNDGNTTVLVAILRQNDNGEIRLSFNGLNQPCEAFKVV